MSLIVAEGVTKTYFIDNTTLDAVKNVTLEIEKGEFVSIIGHSGSGKTTILSILGGMARPTSGKVLFKGREVFSLDSDELSEYRCEKVGFIFQFSSLLPMLTAKENLLLPVSFRHRKERKGDEAEERALDLLNLVGLGDKTNAYPSQLSGGQQRRVAIARAFMNEPELVLADEPTGDLDEETEAEMMKFFTLMNREKDTTFLMATHNTELARQTGRRMRMHSGSIQEL